MFTGMMHRYCQNRAQGLKPVDACMAAGYAPSGAAVTSSRMEARADVQTEIARLKKGAKSGKIVLTPPDATAGGGKSPLLEWAMKDHYSSPLDLHLDVMNNPEAPKGLRIQCAKDALPYCHARKEGSKKQERDDDAKKVAKKSRFATQGKPQLRAV